MSSPIIPDFLAQMLSPFRKLFHAASWDSFRAIILGLLLELSNSSLVRASLVSGPEYNWRRTHDFMRRNRWSHQKTIATHCSTTVQSLYGDSLPEKLFWAADGTTTDKPSARKIHGVRTMRRSYKRYGQRTTHRGHGWVVLGLLSKTGRLSHRCSLIGGLMKTRHSSETDLACRLVTHARLPKQTTNIVVCDRGFGSIKAVKKLEPKGIKVLVRMKKDDRVYEVDAPPPTGKRGRPRTYGYSWQVSRLPMSHWGATEKVQTKVSGKKKWVSVKSCVLRRKGLAVLVKVFRVKLPKKVLYLQSTDLSLTAGEAVWGYLGRQSIEVAISEAKELGLGDYRGRRAKGVRRWATMVCIAQSLLQQMSQREELREQLPRLNWPWYEKENTVGAVRRRLITGLIQEGLFEGFSSQWEEHPEDSKKAQVQR